MSGQVTKGHHRVQASAGGTRSQLHPCSSVGDRPKSRAVTRCGVLHLLDVMLSAGRPHTFLCSGVRSHAAPNNYQRPLSSHSLRRASSAFVRIFHHRKLLKEQVRGLRTHHRDGSFQGEPPFSVYRGSWSVLNQSFERDTKAKVSEILYGTQHLNEEKTRTSK